MEDEHEEEGLAGFAGKALKHIFSVAMVGMMVSMALPAVAAAAPAGAATLGDLGLGLLDHYWGMATNPVTEFGTLSDVFNNTLNGEFAASSYELGGSHLAHGADAAAHVVTETVSAANTEHFQTGFTEWLFNQTASGQLMPLDGLVDGNLVDYFADNVYHPPEHAIH